MEERVFFMDVMDKYPDSYIGLRDIRREKNGKKTGILVKVASTWDEVVKVMELITDCDQAIIEGTNLLNVERIGGITFDHH